MSESVHVVPVSCCITSPVESRPGDVNYTSGGTPLINDIRPARRDNVRSALRRPPGQAEGMTSTMLVQIATPCTNTVLSYFISKDNIELINIVYFLFLFQIHHVGGDHCMHGSVIVKV